MSEANTRTAKIPVVDIFAGAGGLGEGFTSYPSYGNSVFDVKLSIDKERAALDTLRLRSFFNLFPNGDAPKEYYDFIRAGHTADIDSLSSGFKSEWCKASGKVLGAELGNGETDNDGIDVALETAIGRKRRDWVLIGGPPCQAYSSAGKSRNKKKDNYRPEEDQRHFLYEEYLRIISRHWPAVVVMENVTGILSSSVSGKRIFANVLRDLSDPAGLFRERRRSHSERYKYRIFPLAVDHSEPDLFGYSGKPADYIVESENFGVPQRRHRVILLAVRDDISTEPERLKPFTGSTPNTEQVLSGIPALRCGLTDVDDSDQAWEQILKSAKRETWLREVRQLDGGTEVRERILDILDDLQRPEHGRGGQFVSFRGNRRRAGTLPAHLKDWLVDKRLEGFSHHETRSHMSSDLHRYLFCAAYTAEHGVSPKLRHFPPSLLPDHRSVKAALNGRGSYGDRFRVQVAGEPATTVMSHIARDGHYYIHPDPAQCRSLTVREVARLQTFPDNYYFCGSRGDKYTQVGNVVPPYLARQIAEIAAGVMTG